MNIPKCFQTVTVALLALFAALAGPQVHAGTRPMANSAGELRLLDTPDSWEEEAFSGNTDYTFLERDGRTVLKAESRKSASAMFIDTSVDLSITPYINWKWMVAQALPGLDETQKYGDDYAARVYVVFAVGPFFWQKRSLTYVWSGNKAQGQFWPNAYTPKAIMLAVRDGSHPVQQWVHEKRNVKEDIKKYFNLDISRLEGVAIMTDSDNSNRQATAFYGDLFFSQN